MKVEIVNVTPAMARLWLKRNTVINRPLRRSWVETLKAAFERGEYIMTHQGVAFSESGELLDGQHRLTAISELPDGCSFPMFVSKGFRREEVFRAIDGGYKRSAADMIGRDRREVEVARLIFEMFGGFTPTPTAMIPVCERIAPWHSDLVSFCNARSRTWSSAPVRTAAVLTMMNDGDADYVRLVYRALVTNDLPGMPRSAQALVTAYLRGQLTVHPPYDIFCRCLKVFDPGKESLTKIQIKDQSAMIAQVRDFVGVAFFGEPGKKKKAATVVTASKGNSKLNHTPRNLHPPLH